MEPIYLVCQDEARFVRPLISEFMEPEEIRSLVIQLREALLKSLTFNRFNLSNRAMNMLARNGLKSVWDCKQLNANQVYRLKWCGPKTSREVYEIVRLESGILLNSWA